MTTISNQRETNRTSRSRASGTRPWRCWATSAVAALALLLITAVTTTATAATFKVEYERAVASYKAGEYETALDLFKKAYKLKKHPLCLFGMAQTHRKLENVGEAIRLYERYLATKPAADLVKEVKGYLSELRTAKEALDATAKARKLFSVGDFTGAAAAYERAYEIKPAGETLFNVALSHEKAGNKVKAVEFYERFLKSEPSPELKSEAEKALGSLREEPDPVGSTAGSGGTGTSDAGSGGTGSSGALTVDPDESGTPKKGGSKTGLFIGIGGGVLVAGAVVLVVVLVAGGGGPDIPNSDLGNMTVSF